MCYAGLDEPLLHTQVLPYLGELRSRGLRIGLITFETRWPVPGRESRRERLDEQGVEWRPLRYHTRPYLPAKLFDIGIGALATHRLARRMQATVLHGRSHVGAAICLLASRLAQGRRFIFDVRGLLADEYADSGHWRTDGLAYRLTKAMERALFRRADGIVVLTEAIRSRLIAEEPAFVAASGRVQVIPCCVDVDRYAMAAADREGFRESRGWQGRTVLVYAGKLGASYLHREMTDLFAALVRREPSALFAVFTPSPADALLAALAERGVAESSYQIGRLDPADVPRALNAADAGVSFVMPSFSRLAMSPTKLGEYLAAGLPVVINRGIGDSESIVDGRGVGVVVREFTAGELVRAAGALVDLMGSPGLRDRCRQAAADLLSLSGIGGPRYAEVYSRLIPGFPSAERPLG